MKIKNKFMLYILLAVFVLCTPIYAEDKDSEIKLKIVTPSDEQKQIAPYRDFYVLGNIEGTVPNTAKMQFELCEEGSGLTLQTLYADSKFSPEKINYNYSLLNYYGKDRYDLAASMMPDLLYDPNNPLTFKEAWRKCCFSNRTFTGVFCGGSYDRDLELTDHFGKP